MKNVKNPQPGDVADHRTRDLDPRTVARVEGDQVWLYLVTNEPSGPFPAANYTYKRETKAEREAAERRAALGRLRIVFPEGSTVTTIVRHVSDSGMQRAIQIVGVDAEDGAIEDYTYLLIRAGLWKRHRNQPGVTVNGAGMDMGYHVVHTLARHLYGDGYALQHRSL